ncbi:MAG: hypothetical protein WA254_21400 [Candidatus Sulfotelmatobacter sp.]
MSLRGEVEIFTPGLERYFTSGFIGGAAEHLRDQPKVFWRGVTGGESGLMFLAWNIGLNVPVGT